MVLSGSELELVNGIVRGAQNVSTYGYEVMIKGTIVDGIASLICGIFTTIFTLLIAKKLYIWAKKDEESRPSYDKGFSYALAAVGVIVTLIALAMISSSVIYDPFMKIFAPEYIVVNKILEAAANVAN